MRIAVFVKSTTFSSSYGGLETQNKLLCEGLSQRGHEVVVYSPKKDLPDESENENGVLYKFVDCKIRQYSSATVSKKESWPERSYEVFRNDHSQKAYDLIISQSSGGVGVIRNRMEFGLPIISVAHGTKIGELQTKIKSDTSVKGLISTALDLPHVLKNFFTVQRDFVHGSDIVVAVSSAVKKALIEETFVDESKVKVINNGINPIEISEGQGNLVGQKNLRLLYVGQLIKSKGIGRLSELLISDEMNNFTLDIVGSGDLSDELMKISSTSGGRIKLHGKKPYLEVLKMYNPADFDVFVFPTSRLEGFPMVLVEAMFGCLPIVAFNIGGVSDAVEDGETGYLVKSGDFTVFKEKLMFLQRDMKTAKEMGLKARNKAITRFSLDKMLDSYEGVFEEVLKKK